MNIEDFATFCKKKGIAFRSADAYGGYAGFYDYGPLGARIKRNVVNAWLKFLDRRNIVPFDGTIVTNPKVWEASGHVATFGDLMLTTVKTRTKVRADHFIEETLNIAADGMSADEIQTLINKHKLQYNGEDFEPVQQFNLMFQTQVGAVDGNTAYLRPETAQSIFAQFALIKETSRLKPPFGVCQVGKAYRNEISPRDFLFRLREFNQMEMEFFVHPEKGCELSKELLATPISVLSEEHQGSNADAEEYTFQWFIDKGVNTWQVYWLYEYYHFYVNTLGVSSENLRVREHVGKELSHYSSATFDIEYKFPFGFKEVFGIAHRGDYDLQAHAKHSGMNVTVVDDATQKKFVPHCIEPTHGLERVMLMVLFEAYSEDDRGHVNLALPVSVAPFNIAVLPLVKNKAHLLAKAEEVFTLLKECYSVSFDVSGSIGRRYARADEMGVPYCVTVDFESLEDGCVTVRDRDTMEQERVKIEDLSF